MQTPKTVDSPKDSLRKQKKTTKATGKTPHNNISNSKQTIKPYLQDLEDSLFSYRAKPIDMAYLEQFADEMLEWSKSDDSLKITQYYNLKLIHNTIVDKWMERCPRLRQAHDLALQIIGARREIGALNKKFDATMIMRSMPLYDKAWRNIEEWRANIGAENAPQAPQVIYVEKFPSSALVPEKRDS